MSTYQELGHKFGHKLKPSFGRGVLVAAGITVIGTVAASFSASHLGIYLMAFTYLCHILYHSPRTTGRVAIVATWLAGTVVFSVFDASTVATLSFNIGSLWLARSWCHLDTVLQALADLGLWFTSFALASVAILHSTSYPLGIWTFFLVQALWPWLAQTAGRWTLGDLHTNSAASTTTNDNLGNNLGNNKQTVFNEAKRNAERALHRLQSQ